MFPGETPEKPILAEVKAAELTASATRYAADVAHKAAQVTAEAALKSAQVAAEIARDSNIRSSRMRSIATVIAGLVGLLIVQYGKDNAERKAEIINEENLKVRRELEKLDHEGRKLSKKYTQAAMLAAERGKIISTMQAKIDDKDAALRSYEQCREIWNPFMRHSCISKIPLHSGEAAHAELK